MRKSRALRDQWFKTLVADEVKFNVVVEMSKTEEYGPLGKIKLLDVLSSRRGWTDITAREAMIHFGFSVKDNIESIRRSNRNVEQFAFLMESNSDMWRPRPSMPKGWPFRGKLIGVIQSQQNVDIKVPDELDEFMSHLDEEEPRRPSGTDDNDMEPDDIMSWIEDN